MEIDEAKEIIKAYYQQYRCGFEIEDYTYLGFRLSDKNKTSSVTIKPFNISGIQNKTEMESRLKNFQSEILASGISLD